MTVLDAPPRALPARFSLGRVRLSTSFVDAVRALDAEPREVADLVLEEHAELRYAETGFDWVSEHELYRVPSSGGERETADTGLRDGLAVLAVTSPDHSETFVVLATEWETC